MELSSLGDRGSVTPCQPHLPHWVTLTEDVFWSEFLGEGRESDGLTRRRLSCPLAPSMAAAHGHPFCALEEAWRSAKARKVF